MLKSLESLRRMPPSGLLWLWFSQVAGILASFSVSAICARTLPPETFQAFSLWQVVLAFALITTELGTSYVGSRRWMSGTSDAQRHELERAILAVRLIGAVTACLGLAFTLGAELIPLTAGNWYLFAGVICWLTAFSPEWHQIASHDERMVASARLARSVVLLSGALILAYFHHAQILILSFAAAAGLQLFVSTRSRKLARAGGSVPLVRSIALEGAPLGAALMAQQFVWSAGLLMAAKDLSPEIFGGQAVGFRFYSVGIALLASVSSYVLPRTAAALERGVRDLFIWRTQLMRNALIASFLVAVTSPLVAFVLVPLFFGRIYPSAPSHTFLYLLALIPSIWRITNSSMLVALGSTKLYFILCLSGAAAVAFTLWLLPSGWQYKPVLSAVCGELVFGLACYIALRCTRYSCKLS